ncbi:IS3 family transposase [Microbispora sp. GKU 823]|uniref:IS3 family transposase n=1 Tax=Microbispora sp. GKU 823 TaxID=1652100 RepID=UPI0009A436B6
MLGQRAGRVVLRHAQGRTSGRTPLVHRAAARSAIFEFIESWYNLRRLHSSLGHVSPAAYEETRAARPPHQRCPSKRNKLTTRPAVSDLG